MRRTERVVSTFRSLRETTQTVLLPKRPDAIAPPGQNFMRVALVTDVPDQFVLWGIEHCVQCNGQFDNTETRAKMTARFANGVNGLGAQFLGQTLEVVV